LNAKFSIFAPMGTSAVAPPANVTNAASVSAMGMRVCMRLIVPREQSAVNRRLSGPAEFSQFRASTPLTARRQWAGLAPTSDMNTMRRIAVALVLAIIVPSSARAGCDWWDRLCFSAASPSYPLSEFWAPRWYRLHACHAPVSVNVLPRAHCEGQVGFMPVGPYCPGSQPHFPVEAPTKP